MDVRLVMFKVDGERREFPLRKSRTIVGRTNDCDLRIPLSSVSRRQCEMVIETDAVMLRDLGSSNGTYHNHIRIQEVALAPGDEVAVGPVVFTVVIDGQPADIDPVRTMVGGASVQEGAGPGAEDLELEGDEDAIDLAHAKPRTQAEPRTQAMPRTQATPLPTEDESDIDLPSLMEEETDSPTVELDDPIAALEALADEVDEEADDKPRG